MKIFIKILAIFLLLLALSIGFVYYKSDKEYKLFLKKYEILEVGEHYDVILKKTEEMSRSNLGKKTQDTTIFTISINGPIEWSEDIYLNFNKDSILIEKKIVH